MMMEIVFLSMKNDGFFHNNGVMLVYQRVHYWMMLMENVDQDSKTMEQSRDINLAKKRIVCSS